MDRESKNYELAYLFSPSVTEEEILQKTGEITTFIEENKGVLKHAENPKKIKLAYPIKKEKTAYFGYSTFTIDPAMLGSLDKKIKRPEILRYLLVEEELGRRPPAFKPQPSRLPVFKQRTIPREEAVKEDEKLDLEALDKKLEEILGK